MSSKFVPSKRIRALLLLTIFLIVVVGVLAYWMSIAEEPYERIVAGASSVVILMTILIIFYKVANKIKESEKIQLKSLNKEVNPAKEEITEEEIKKVSSEQIAGPDRSYVINKPPEAWKSMILSESEWVKESLELEQSILESTEGELQEKILYIKSPNKIIAFPEPGKSKVNGKKIPTAFMSIFQTSLAIKVMPRFQPPVYLETPFEQNMLKFISEIIRLGSIFARSMSVKTNPITKHRFYVFEFRQDLENAIIDNEKGKNVSMYVTILGIKGEIKDYLIIIKNVSVYPLDEKLENEKKILESLLDSFKPLKIIDAEQVYSKMKEHADEEFEKYIKINSSTGFESEFGLFTLRLSSNKLKNEDEFEKIMMQLKQYRKWAEMINYKNEDVDKIWPALTKAEQGEQEDLIKILEGISSSITKNGGNAVLAHNTDEVKS